MRPDRELLAAPGRGEVESEDGCERADEQQQPGPAAQIAAEVGAQRGEPDRDGDVAHHLAQQRPSVALDRFAGERRDRRKVVSYVLMM